jgi:phosphoglycolate phosphatase-like HAD superfamily hydrolase
MRYDIVIFDFDGTLGDSFRCFVSAQDALAPKRRFRARCAARALVRRRARRRRGHC